MTIKSWVLPIILVFMIGFIPVGAEKNSLPEYELTLVLDDNWGNPVVDGFNIKLDGMDMYKSYGCKVYSEKSGCQLVIILQNEKIIKQHDRMIEQFDIMIAQNENMLDIATVVEFDDWYP